MKNLKDILSRIIKAAQNGPSPPPGSIPIPDRRSSREKRSIRPTAPTPPSTPPSTPPITSPDDIVYCSGETPPTNWPPRVPRIYPEYETGATEEEIAKAMLVRDQKQCNKIKSHFATLNRHLRDCSGKCRGWDFDWDKCLEEKWKAYELNSDPISINTLTQEYEGVYAATPYSMPEAPQEETEDAMWPIRPGRNIKNCSIWRDRCRCSFLLAQRKHMIAQAELAEKKLYKCFPFNGSNRDEKFITECRELTQKKPSIDKCFVKDGDYVYGDWCQKFCQGC